MLGNTRIILPETSITLEMVWLEGFNGTTSNKYIGSSEIGEGLLCPAAYADNIVCQCMEL